MPAIIQRDSTVADILIKPVMDFFSVEDYSIDKIEKIETEKRLSMFEHHDIVIDLNITLKGTTVRKGKKEVKNYQVILTEFQKSHMERIPPKRIRYYLSALDVFLLKEGEQYEDLLETFFILYSSDPVFDTGKAVHIFPEYPPKIDRKGLPITYGQYSVLINGKYKKVDDERLLGLVEIIQDLQNRNDNLSNPILKEVKSKIKYTLEGREMMQQIVDELVSLKEQINQEKLELLELKVEYEKQKREEERQDFEEKSRKFEEEKQKREEEKQKREEEIEILRQQLIAADIIPAV